MRDTGRVCSAVSLCFSSVFPWMLSVFSCVCNLHIFFGEISNLVLCPIFWLFSLLLLTSQNRIPLSDIHFVKIFSQSVRGRSLPYLWFQSENTLFTIKYNVYGFSCSLSSWRSFLLFLVCWEFLTWMDIELCQIFFLNLLRWTCVFSFCIC